MWWPWRKIRRADISPIDITAVDPRIPEALELIRALSEELAQRYEYVDNGSGHFSLEDALTPRSLFLIGRVGSRAVGCGAFRQFEGDIAEIKRMFVVPDCRGRGYSKAILTELAARKDGYIAVCLETAERQPEATQLYKQSGYQRIPNFGIYVNSKRSVCFEKRLL
jgi:GNAT superfamily N-acetyltransferase